MSALAFGLGPLSPPEGAAVVRVSRIDSFYRWTRGDVRMAGMTQDEFIADQLRDDDESTEEQARGRAFHAAMESLRDGVHDIIEADGFRFYMPDCEIALPLHREMRVVGRYGPLYVTGACDLYDALVIEDYKTSEHGFSAEYYLDGLQWRFYLDLFDAIRFRWQVYRMRPRRGVDGKVVPRAFDVEPPERLEAVRYPAMHADLVEWSTRYYEFVQAHFPIDRRFPCHAE